MNCNRWVEKRKYCGYLLWMGIEFVARMIYFWRRQKKKKRQWRTKNRNVLSDVATRIRSSRCVMHQLNSEIEENVSWKLRRLREILAFIIFSKFKMILCLLKKRYRKRQKKETFVLYYVYIRIFINNYSGIEIGSILIDFIKKRSLLIEIRLINLSRSSKNSLSLLIMQYCF